jgi:hypothetical protein
VTEVFNTLSRQTVVLVRAPPQTGKTSFAQLLAVEASRQNWKCRSVAVCHWPQQEADLIGFLRSNDGPSLLIVDEAQLSYPSIGLNSRFWMELSTCRIAAPLRVVFFSSYYAHAVGDVHAPVEFDSSNSFWTGAIAIRPGRIQANDVAICAVGLCFFRAARMFLSAKLPILYSTKV